MSEMGWNSVPQCNTATIRAEGCEALYFRIAAANRLTEARHISGFLPLAASSLSGGDGVEECHFELAFPYGYGSGLFFNRPSVTEWDNVSVPECVISIGQSIPPMVYGVVIG